MSPTDTPLIDLDSQFRRSLAELGVDWTPTEVPEPRLLLLNEPLARAVGLDPERLRQPDGVALLAGNLVPGDAHPIAMAYAGHQFGNFSPRLGDGRALLLGELAADGRPVDLHLKGSGRTPFARGGDGKAALGPMLREYVLAEAMHALGIPTTRSLAVVATGETIRRETPVPGGVLARLADSHIRVGTFEYAARTDPELVRRLADYSLQRHHPSAANTDEPYLGFLDAVMESQASLVAKWMEVGFIHGVMNTDNMTISGETIDYGPCAFLDRYDPSAVFSSIDHGGRYAFGNQPAVAQWNLARLAETLLPLIDSDTDAAVAKATGLLEGFPARFRSHWHRGMAAKLGLDPASPAEDDPRLINEFLGLIRGASPSEALDYTLSFRHLANVLRDNPAGPAFFAPAAGFADWQERWRQRLPETSDSAAHADAMDAVNPLYIPRNHLVEEALAAGVDGDLDPFTSLLSVLESPFTVHEGGQRYAEPAPDEFTRTYQTFCGT